MDDPFGHYEAPGLELLVNGQRLVSITPHAGVVIGADGRIDFDGCVDKLAALYLSGPGQSSVDIYGTRMRSRELFSGYSEPGWYWFVSNETMEVRRIDRPTFRIMISAASDFELDTA